MTLQSAIVSVMRGGRAMSVGDISKTVKKSGYKTQSKSFGNQVSNTLAKMEEVTKVGRGVFKI